MFLLLVEQFLNVSLTELQNLQISRGFTKFSRAEYLAYKAENKIVPDGVNAKVSYIAFIHMLAILLFGRRVSYVYEYATSFVKIIIAWN